MVRRPGATPRALGLKQAYRPACQRRPWGPILHQGLLHVSKWSAPTINRDPRVPCLVSPQPSPPQRVRRPEVCPWEQGTRVQRHSGEKRDSANQWAKGSSWDTSRLNLHAQHEGQSMAGKSGGKKEGKAKVKRRREEQEEGKKNHWEDASVFPGNWEGAVSHLVEFSAPTVENVVRQSLALASR